MGDSDLLSGIGSSLACIVVIGIAAAVVAALIYLVKQARKEELAAKLELQELVRSIPRESQAAFMIQYNAQKKNSTTAVVLALLLGGIGAHKFYLGKTGQGILYLVFFWSCVPAIIAFFEAFAMPHTVTQMNREMAREVAAMLGGDIATPAALV